MAGRDWVVSDDVLDDSWSTTLVRLGGSIHQDEAEPLSDDDEAIEQAGIEQYQEMLDALTGEESASVLESVLWSLHPIDDYGIYEAAYAAVRLFDPVVLGQASAQVLPEWLLRNGNHHSVQAAISSVAYRDDVREAFVSGAASWTTSERAVVLDAVGEWMRDDEDWETVYVSLGGVAPVAILDPIPEEWPDDWRLAAEGFRDSGRVDLAWPDERDLASNFERVFALVQLGHGARWREVGDFLNILFVRRRSELPVFAKALAELPSGDRAAVLAALERSRPGISEALDAAS